jgi:hypothetical protein
VVRETRDDTLSSPNLARQCGGTGLASPPASLPTFCGRLPGCIRLVGPNGVAVDGEGGTPRELADHAPLQTDSMRVRTDDSCAGLLAYTDE